MLPIHHTAARNLSHRAIAEGQAGWMVAPEVLMLGTIRVPPPGPCGSYTEIIIRRRLVPSLKEAISVWISQYLHRENLYISFIEFN